jgi:hypothetical protein
MFKKTDQEIIFYAVTDEAAKYIDPPAPSSKYNIPQWFRDIPKYANNDKSFKFIGESNLTVKACLPVIDSLTIGYTFVLHCDVQVHREDDGKAVFTWSYNNESIAHPVVFRGKSFRCGWDDLEGYDNLEFNWKPSWNIKTPKGYSSIVAHPINRIDLPFYTLGGIMDTDGWGDSGNHPFLLKKGWEGIIPKNTPIFQVIPFKRDNWKNRVDETLIPEYMKKIFTRNSFLKDYYKKNIWNNKNYK